MAQSKQSNDDDPDFEEGNEVEVAAQITVPKEGGWGWVVVAASATMLAIVDGTVFTYGSLLNAVARELHVSITLSSLINSIALLFYFSAGPIVSALINRFGFRATSMTGSILSSFAFFFCYFLKDYALICILYGVFGGFGFCCMQLPASLVAGFYFEKLRSLAISLSLCGSCLGIIILSPATAYIVSKCNYHTVILMQAGLLGMCYFIGMTFRPLLSVTVVTVIDDVKSKSKVILPSVTKASGSKNQDELKPTQSERVFRSVSNKNYPTAAKIIEDPKKLAEDAPQTSNVASSKKSVSKIQLKPTGTDKMSSQQMKQFKDVAANVQSKLWIDVEKQDEPEKVDRRRKKKKKSCCSCCTWESHAADQRPFYRDDVFYEGSVKNLPVYQQSVASIPDNEKTGLEYQMAVSRAVAVDDLTQNRGFFPASVRRVLATMLDVTLLKRWSFLLLCLNGFLTYMGIIVPFIFAVDRAIEHGLDPEISKFLLSAMNFTVLVGRLAFAYVGGKFDPIMVFAIVEIFCGICLALANLLYTLWYQYLVLIFFGVFASALSTLRSLVLVKMYGIEKLTNSMGLMLLFCGVGVSLGGPLFITLNQVFDKALEFYCGGAVFLTAGITLLAGPKLVALENAKIAERENALNKPVV